MSGRRYMCARVFTSVPVPLRAGTLTARTHVFARVCAINTSNELIMVANICSTSPPGENQVDGLPPVSNTGTRISVTAVVSYKCDPFRRSNDHNSDFGIEPFYWRSIFGGHFELRMLDVWKKSFGAPKSESKPSYTVKHHMFFGNNSQSCNSYWNLQLRE